MSLFSGVLSLALGRRAAKIYLVVLELVAIALAAILLVFCIRSGKAFTFVLGEFPAPWGNELRAGILEAILVLTFLTVEFCAVQMGGKFLKIDVDESKLHLYNALVHLLRAALLALVFTNDIFTGYVFLEISTLTSCGILIIRQIGRTTLAAVRYMVLNLLGSGLFLLGLVLLYAITGHLLMVPMHEVIVELSSNPNELMTLALSTGILTIGLCIKIGLFPFHFWMPDTYGWATPTSAALLAGLVSKGYLILLIKIYLRVIGTEVLAKMQISRILFVLGILGMVFGSVSALRAKNVNHMVAFSSAAQIGYIFMGIGIGGLAGYTAAIFHILTHCVTKALLFLTTPYLAEVSGGSLRFRDLQGSAHRARTAGLFFLVGSFSMVGIPIFAGFSSKLLFALAAVSAESFVKIILTMLALALSSVLNALYFLRTMIRIYTVGKGGSETSAAREYERLHGLSGDGQVADAAVPSEQMPTAAAIVDIPEAASHGSVVSQSNESCHSEEQSDEESRQQGSKRKGILHFAYLVPALILVAMNLFLGLNSGAVVELIEKGLAMFL
ncbi:MAG: complex I subunit 5 family protein [Lachnospiraceae bacterium]